MVAHINLDGNEIDLKGAKELAGRLISTNKVKIDIANNLFDTDQKNILPYIISNNPSVPIDMQHVHGRSKPIDIPGSNKNKIGVDFLR